MTAVSAIPLLVAAVAAAASPAQAAAQQQRPPAAGVLVERVACPSDRTQTYTLYLPSTYSRERKWPLLFVFDPRGRGTLAAEIFRPGAERFGWIIASSDNTSSDATWTVNQRAVNAMWPDVRAAYSVDESRIYAAGFSGGATVALSLAASGARLAGIVGVGGPDLPDVPAPTGTTAWFGAAGRSDFNYLDVKRTAERFERAGIRTRLEFFDGPHTWLPAELATRALGWFEALLSGIAPSTQSAAPADVGAEEFEYARRLRDNGRPTDARRVLGVLVRDYPATPAAVEAAEVARALDRDEQYRKAVRDEKKQDDRERNRLGPVVTALMTLSGVDVQPAGALLSQLEIRDLLKAADRPGYSGESARRTLEQIFVQTSFYIWRELERREQWAQSAVSLEIALAIHPERPRLWVDLGAAHAMQRRRGPALEALERAIGLGYKDGGALRSDRRFASIRASEAFQRLLARMPAA